MSGGIAAAVLDYYFKNEFKNINDFINKSEYAIRFTKTQMKYDNVSVGFISLLYFNINKINEYSYTISINKPKDSDFRSLDKYWGVDPYKITWAKPTDPELRDLSHYMYDIDTFNYNYVIQQRDNQFENAEPNKTYRMYRLFQDGDNIYFYREYTRTWLETYKSGTNSGILGLDLATEKTNERVRNLEYIKSSNANITPFINAIANKLTSDIYTKYKIDNNYINRIKFIPKVTIQNDQIITLTFEDSLLDISPLQGCIETINKKINNKNDINNILLDKDNNGTIAEIYIKFGLKLFTRSNIVYSLSIVKPTGNNIFKLKNIPFINKLNVGTGINKAINLKPQLNVSYIINKFAKTIETNPDIYNAMINGSYVFNYDTTSNKYFIYRDNVNFKSAQSINYINKKTDITTEMNELLIKISQLSIFNQTSYSYNNLLQPAVSELTITLNNSFTIVPSLNILMLKNVNINILNNFLNTPNRFKTSQTLNKGKPFLIDTALNQNDIISNINKINFKISNTYNLNNIFINNDKFNGLLLESYMYFDLYFNQNEQNSIIYSLNLMVPDKYNIFKIQLNKPIIYIDNNKKFKSKFDINKYSIETDTNITNQFIKSSNIKLVKESDNYYLIKNCKTYNTNDNKKINITDEVNAIFNQIPIIPNTTTNILVEQYKINYIVLFNSKINDSNILI